MANNILQHKHVSKDERRSRALAALILHSGATEISDLDLSNPLIASSSISEIREQLDIVSRTKGVPLSKTFKRILSSRPVLDIGERKQWEKIDDARWKNLKYRNIAHRLSGLLYSEVDVFQVNYTRDETLPGSPLQYHIASLVTKSSLGYFVSELSRETTIQFDVKRMLDLDPLEFPLTRSHTGSMNRTRETLRTWPKHKAITGNDLIIHNTIINLILNNY